MVRQRSAEGVAQFSWFPIASPMGMGKAGGFCTTGCDLALNSDGFPEIHETMPMAFGDNE